MLPSANVYTTNIINKIQPLSNLTSNNNNIYFISLSHQLKNYCNSAATTT